MTEEFRKELNEWLGVFGDAQRTGAKYIRSLITDIDSKTAIITALAQERPGRINVDDRPPVGQPEPTVVNWFARFDKQVQNTALEFDARRLIGKQAEEIEDLKFQLEEAKKCQKL